MNPIHLKYIKKHPFNDFAELFAVIDRLDPKKRDAAMLDTFCQFVKMQKAGAPLDDQWGGIWSDYVNYRRFKEECLALPPNLNEAFMVNSIVSYTLSIRFGWAELDRDKMIEISRVFVAKMSELLKNVTTEKMRESCQGMIKWRQERIANIDDEIQQAKELYAYICENLAQPLLVSWETRLHALDPTEE